jgi:hypothetical protein
MSEQYINAFHYRKESYPPIIGFLLKKIRDAPNAIISNQYILVDP